MYRLIYNKDLDEPLCWDEEKEVWCNYDVEKEWDGYVIADEEGYLYWAGDGSDSDIQKGLGEAPIMDIEYEDYANCGEPWGEKKGRV